MRPKAFLTVLTFSTLILAVAAAGKPQVEFNQNPGAIDVLVDSELFTSYIHQIDPATPMAAEGVLSQPFEPICLPEVTQSRQPETL